ncbi:MAG: methyltransferase [Armatimonadetes bacterium CG_4_10_14_3_um_filter_66_18]|nr:MAG: methyltransferase [Armatimonadetes bacterium CG_4_10_14_3_um_filter_66_18]
MASRHRVLAALNHREPDRVPLDLGGSFVTSIAATSLHHLRERLGLEDRPVKVYDAYQMLGEVEVDLVERFRLDCLPVEPPALTLGLRRENWKPWTLMDGTEVLMPGQFEIDVNERGDWLAYASGDRSRPPVARMPKDGFYFDSIGYGDWHPDWQPPSLDSIRAGAKSWLVCDEDLAFLRAHAELLRRNTDKALVLGAWPYTGLHYVGALVDFWTLLAGDPGYVKELFAISTEAALTNLDRLWRALGDNVDVIALTGLDFGTQRSEWFSREVFQEVYLPGLRAQFQRIRANTTWKSFEHSCGSIANLVGDLAEAGLDALNPVQTSAAGMDPAWLKKTVGDRLTFWGGGVETQSTLPFGTPEEVRAEVADRLRTFAPGGGFVFCPVHNIQPNTPPENIVAAYDAAWEFGSYPIAPAAPE